MNTLRLTPYKKPSFRFAVRARFGRFRAMLRNVWRGIPLCGAVSVGIARRFPKPLAARSSRAGGTKQDNDLAHLTNGFRPFPPVQKTVNSEPVSGWYSVAERDEFERAHAAGVNQGWLFGGVRPW